MPNPFNVAVIGLGGISNAHLRTLGQLDEVTIAAVVEPVVDRLNQIAGETGARGFTELAPMLAEISPAICVVCAPHGLHAPTAVACLRAGAHVFIEKPMANTAAQCDEILAAADEASRQVMVGYTWHYRAPLREAKKFLDEVGEPVLFGVSELSYDFPNPNRSGWFFSEEMGGGSLLANGCHAIDWLRWGIGQPAESVVGLVRHKPDDLPVDSVAAAQIRFAGGAVGQMICWGLHSLGSRARFEFRTEHFGVAWSRPEGLVGYRHGEAEELPLEQGEDAFLTQHRQFLAAIRTGEPVPTPGGYGREINAIVDAMRESWDRGEQVRVQGA